VHRLTGELGAWYEIDAGTLREGDRADIVVINPDKLDQSLDRYAEHPVESYGGLSRMVNRNDETVTAVLVSGKLAFGAGKASPELGQERFGEFLRAGSRARKLAHTG
jgi:N-acyl-D-aspartate/D-glutamate deacylase